MRPREGLARAVAAHVHARAQAAAARTARPGPRPAATGRSRRSSRAADGAAAGRVARARRRGDAISSSAVAERLVVRCALTLPRVRTVTAYTPRPSSRRSRSSCAAAGGSPARRRGASAPCARRRRGSIRSSSSSDAPPRSGSRRSVSWIEKRQVRSLPSAVRRIAVAVGAERLGHRVDEADLALAVGEAEHARGGVRLARHLLERVHARAMIARISSPVSTWSGVQAWSPSSGMNSMKRTWKLVERANSANGSASSSVKPRSATALTLIGRTSGMRRDRLEPAQHLRQRVAPGDLEEAVALERVDRHVHALDARLDERVGVALEQVAVGGERQVLDARDARRASPASRGNSRRTSGSPPVRRRSVTPIAREQPHEALDLLEAEDLRALEPGQALGGHAVLAAEVAAVGDRDAQVGDRAGRGRRQSGSARHRVRRRTRAWSSRRWRSALPRGATAGSRRLLAAANADERLRAWWHMQQVNADRRGMSDHSWVHVRIVLNIALRLFRLLNRGGRRARDGHRARDEAARRRGGDRRGLPVPRHGHVDPPHRPRAVQPVPRRRPAAAAARGRSTTSPSARS